MLSTLSALSACSISTPLTGPGFNRADGVTAPGTGDLLAVVTLAERRGDAAKNKLFWTNVHAVRASLDEQPGFVAHSIRRQLIGKRAWTLTVWQDEASLSNFVRSPAHAKAMQQSAADLESMAFARLSVLRAAMPLSWEDALNARGGSSQGYGASNGQSATQQASKGTRQ